MKKNLSVASHRPLTSLGFDQRWRILSRDFFFSFQQKKQFNVSSFITIVMSYALGSEATHPLWSREPGFQSRVRSKVYSINVGHSSLL